MAGERVSIVICTRNRGNFLAGTLQSIEALDTNVPFEAIIVDNASDDDTEVVIRSFAERDPRFRYLRVDRIGLGAGRDAAWREAEGDIISFTDDDCYLAPDFVDAICTAFDDDPSVGVIGGRILLHDPEDAKVTINESMDFRSFPARQVFLAGEIHGANMSFRKSALAISGGFDPMLGAGTSFPSEDVDAVAATIWAGFPARYDPRPTVSHHHRRKMADLPKLTAGYDAGRGAYWAKYIMRPDTRRAYLLEWWRLSNASHAPYRFKILAREMMSASRYYVKRKCYLALFLFSSLAPLALTYVGVRTALVLFKPK